MLSGFYKLKKAGVLGINGRNALYVLRYNQRKFYPIVDDKLQTKQLATQAGIATPELYAKLSTPADVKQLDDVLARHEAFAMKPAHGVGGDGIIVITAKVQNHFRKANGSIVSQDELKYHAYNIISGMHSLGGQPDAAMIEYCVNVDPIFSNISHHGVPDIRIIILFGYPVMAMVRLPTHMSDGRANLHQGAIGAGIDLATGTTLGGVWHDNTISIHPDTLHPIFGCKIPDWDTVLHIAAQCYELTQLGYLGVDIVLDSHFGPLMLELNARPGLNIQLANRTGLRGRLSLIEKRHASLEESIEARIHFAKQAFSQEH